ncbi:peptidoglycan-binding protein [Grosmannia clavigera kw1407]|uniref:Peptidoglycan-binding protein n=1 Tax=Grosmannia clavigera (strain kw1407 / UAMH 11150) TaxID=655863 RepID=F0XUS5_GROCL|nr:peptidoglycan-binding protein [Grosmannia clavigera kw1407]EFW98601.1 peptidoglycan-binding protein [Grosmannia clavigera kw1407]
MFSSSGIDPPDAESANARPRNRRANAATVGTARTSSGERYGNAAVSPGPAFSSFTTWGGIGMGDGSNAGNSSSRRGGLLSPGSSAWVPSWSSIQEFASTLLASTDSTPAAEAARRRKSGAPRRLPDSWGPAPPEASGSRPGLQDVAAGPVAARDAELRARKKASVLESHPGVNGGLDTRGKFKRRTSDDDLRITATDAGHEAEDCMVYVHHVRPTDTYFGIILKYRCREDVFRRANGLWTRDNIQIRKWLALPVDACEIKGRPCDDPSLVSKSPPAGSSGDYLTSPSASTGSKTRAKAASGDAAGPAWTHVRWVRLESCPDPVEIARVSRTALGYFPPRRKKSIHSTVSSLSTPRQSIDIPADNGLLADRTALPESPRRGSRRQSQGMLGGRAARGASPVSSSPLAGIDGVGAEDTRPAWMRRPGGVGSMGSSVHAPGPARDYFNKWTTKHLPGLTIETLPSMSVMGSETARFGFRDGEEMPGLVESTTDESRDLSLDSGQDSGLDKAAASIEMWLRGAFAKGQGTSSGTGSPAPSSLASRISRQAEDTTGDLIELEDGPGEDGVHGFGSDRTPTGAGSSSWRLDRQGSMRGRNAASASRSPLAKGKKAD